MTGRRPTRTMDRARPDGRARRRHEVIPHTADVGIRAAAPDLTGLFEEAALAVAEVAADLPPDRRAAPEIPVELAAEDLPGLAFAWLNELIGLADVHGPLGRSEVAAVDEVPGGGWRLRARVAVEPGAAPRLDVKSATYHRLVVEPAGDGWRLTAYLDV